MRTRVLPLRVGLVATILALVVSASAAAATGDHQRVQLTAAGQAAAHAIVLTRADLPSGWSGGEVKSDLQADVPQCAGYHPRQSDLTVIGAATSKFAYSEPGNEIENDVTVFRTARMVQLDWQRSIQGAGLVSCLRQLLAKQTKSAGTVRIVSVKRLAFAKVAANAAVVRMVLENTRSNALIFTDLVFLARGRTEVGLNFTAPLAQVESVVRAEVALAGVVATHMTA